jgi:hypothetical protein
LGEKIQDKLTGEVPVLGSYLETLILEVSAGIQTNISACRQKSMTLTQVLKRKI